MGNILPFDPEWARGIVRRVVQRKSGLFSAWPDMDLDYLTDEGLTAALQAWPKFDPRKSAPTTLVYRAAACRLIDLWRVRGRRADRELTTARAGIYHQQDQDDHLSWLQDTYGRLQDVLPDPATPQGPGRPKTLQRPQIVALTVLRVRLGMSLRQFVKFLLDNPEYQQIIGAGGKALHYSQWSRAMRLLQNYQNN